MIANAKADKHARKNASTDATDRAGKLASMLAKKTTGPDHRVDGHFPGVPLAVVAALLLLLPLGHTHADFDSGLKAFGAGRLDDARLEWQKSANEGHGISQYLLAELYEDGEGVDADIIEAHKWYCAAATNGYDGAASDCARLARIIQTRHAQSNSEQARELTAAPASDPAHARTDTVADAPVDPQIASRSERESVSPHFESTESDSVNFVADRLPETPTLALADSTQQVLTVVNDPDNGSDNSSGFKHVEQAALSTESPTTTAAVEVDVSAQVDDIETDVLLMQQLLNQLGHDVGEADGLMGRNTRLAVLAFKKRAGLEVNDKIDEEALQAVRQQIAQIDGRHSAVAHESSPDNSVQPTEFGSDW